MVDWQEGDALVNGIRLHYYRSGGDKPPLVLVHGITDSGQCWPLVSEALTPQYDIVAIDARGHGRSEKPDIGYAREDHAKDVAGLIGYLELERPVVMGHSMGAGTASVLAARFPGLVGSLILEDPPWRDNETAEMQAERAAGWRDRISEHKARGPDELLERGKTDNPGWPDAVFEPWIAAKYAVNPNVFGYITAEAPTWEWVVRSIQCPTLLLTGELDRGAIVAPEIADWASRTNPLIEPVHITGAGHNIRRQRFAEFITAVQAFLKQHHAS